MKDFNVSQFPVLVPCVDFHKHSFVSCFFVKGLLRMASDY